MDRCNHTENEEQVLLQNHINRNGIKTYMAILDFMLVNLFFAWNMLASDVEGRMKVSRHEFYAALS